MNTSLPLLDIIGMLVIPAILPITAWIYRTPYKKPADEPNEPQSKSRLRWDDLTYFPVACPRCGWQGMSNEAAGGHALADTLDYHEIWCPECIAPGGKFTDGLSIPLVDIPEHSLGFDSTDSKP